MLATLTWWGIGLLLATTTLATIIAIIVTWKKVNQGGNNSYKTISAIGVITSTVVFIGFFLYIILILGLRVVFPTFFSAVLVFLCYAYIHDMTAKNVKSSKLDPQNRKTAILSIIVVSLCQAAAIFITLNWLTSSTLEPLMPHDHNQNIAATEKSYKNTLVRSKLIEQNTQHTEANGETFLGAGSFTMRSDSDFKIYHVWQERDASGVLHVNTAQDGEGKDEKKRDKAVIKDDVPKGTEPYVERIPVYETDPLFVKENNGKLCIENQDTNCRVNAKHLYDKVIIHVLAGSVVPSVDPNLPVAK